MTTTICISPQDLSFFNRFDFHNKPLSIRMIIYRKKKKKPKKILDSFFFYLAELLNSLTALAISTVLSLSPAKLVRIVPPMPSAMPPSLMIIVELPFTKLIIEFIFSTSSHYSKCNFCEEKRVYVKKKT
jgi:hypothetical protein